MAGIFAKHAPRYAELGLTVIPAGGTDGKRPLIKRFQCASPNWTSWLVKKFPEANIGILDDRVTIIDIDDPTQLEHATQRYGEPRVVTETPSGGFHLWYQATGEKRRISVGGQKIDICGRGGIHIAPPSERPDGKQYRFVRGGITDLGCLTPLQNLATTGDGPETATRPHSVRPGLTWGQVGRRNKDLFDSGRRLAQSCETHDQLIERLSEVSSFMETTLPSAEIRQVATSVWRYKEEGRLLVPGSEATAFLRKSEIDAEDGTISCGALGLLMRLRLAHGWRNGTPFVLGRAAADAFGMSWNTLKMLRDELVRHGKLRLVNRGGRGPHDPPTVALI